ncbi:MAG: hypothetical protein HOC81_02930 [Candidatus Marinimicrobia bacterium]|nr:hypothetical protein [Candidatus Neomarinimicrobiota bacterium]
MNSLSRADQTIQANPHPKTWNDLSNSSIYLDLSISTLRRAYRAGSLRYTRVGRKIIIHRSWLDAFALNYPKKLTGRQKQTIKDLNSTIE